MAPATRFDDQCALVPGQLFKTGDVLKLFNPVRTGTFLRTPGIVFILTCRGEIGTYAMLS